MMIKATLSPKVVEWLIKALPWVAGALIFWIVSYHFFAPQYDDKSLGQGDIVQYECMSHDIKQHRAEMGEDPQWTGNMFSGMPAYLIDMEHPTQYVKQGAGSVVKLIDGPMNMIFFAMLFMMLAVVLMGINPWIGIIAGLAYGLSTYFFLIIDAGHITKMWALVYAPPMVGAVWYALRQNMWVGAALAALFGSLELGANHTQITYYFLFATLALWLSEAWFQIRDGRIVNFAKRTALLVVAALLAAGSNFSPLWYTATHQKHTVRGASEQTSATDARAKHIAWNTEWSYGCGESFNMLVPNYMGESSIDINDNTSALIRSAEGNKAINDWALERIYERMEAPEVMALLEERLCQQMLADIQQSDPDITMEDVRYMLTLGDEYIDSYADDLYQQIVHDYQIELYAEYTTPIGKTMSNYWGEQPYTAGPTYLGAVVIFLAILGILLTTGRNRWWILAISLFAILLAWGKNFMGFYELMYDILPGYKSFRTVSMALVVVEWSVVVMAAYALMALWRTELTSRQLMVRTLTAAGVVVGLVAIMGLVADYGVADIEAMGDEWWMLQLKDAAYEARRAAFISDAIRTIVYVVMAAAVVVAYIKMRNNEGVTAHFRKFIPAAALAIMGLVVTLDLMGVNERYINDDVWHDKRQVAIEPSRANLDIIAQSEHSGEFGFRVFDYDNRESARASYFHRSVDGYHGAKLGRYDKVLKEQIYSFDPDVLYSFNPDVLAMLNTKYIILDGRALPLQQVVGVEPMGAAWFVAQPAYMATAAQEYNALATQEYDLREYGIVSKSVEGLKNLYGTSGSITLVEYAPNYLKYQYDALSERFVVFSEIYYPDGWSVYVDGEPADYFSVDYILRGMVLPEGNHIVEWKFRAPGWGMATAITGIASWLIFIALIGVAVAPIARRYNLFSIIKNRIYGKQQR